MTKLVKGVNDLKTLFPDLLEEFDKNLNNISPEDLLPGSHKNIYWKCRKNSNHIWVAKLYSRTGKNRSGCPYCNGRIPTPGENDLKTLYPSVSKEFDEILNNISASNASPFSNKLYFWRCKKYSNHIWKSTPDNRIKLNQGCPFCSNQRVLPGFNDLKTKFPEIAKEFAEDLNNISSDHVLSGSPKNTFGGALSIVITSGKHP